MRRFRISIYCELHNNCPNFALFPSFSGAVLQIVPAQSEFNRAIIMQFPVIYLVRISPRQWVLATTLNSDPEVDNNISLSPTHNLLPNLFVLRSSRSGRRGAAIKSARSHSGASDAARHCRARQGRAGQGRAGQGKAGQGRARQGRARQGRAGQGSASAPASAESGRAGQGRARPRPRPRPQPCP